MKNSFLLLILSLSIFDCLAQSNTSHDLDNNKVSVDETFKSLPGKNGEWYSLAMRQNGADVLLYAPKDKDDQTPHDRDELYVIISGSGIFFNGQERFPFVAGDVIFVAAKMEHRFENFTTDFKTWVIFYGDTRKK